MKKIKNLPIRKNGDRQREINKNLMPLKYWIVFIVFWLLLLTIFVLLQK